MEVISIDMWWGILPDVTYLIIFVFLTCIIQVPPWSASLSPWQFKVNSDSVWLWCYWLHLAFPNYASPRCQEHYNSFFFFSFILKNILFMTCKNIFFLFFSPFYKLTFSVSYIFSAFLFSSNVINFLLDTLPHHAWCRCRFTWASWVDGCTDPPCVCGVDSSGSWIMV